MAFEPEEIAIQDITHLAKNIKQYLIDRGVVFDNKKSGFILSPTLLYKKLTANKVGVGKALYDMLDIYLKSNTEENKKLYDCLMLLQDYLTETLSSYAENQLESFEKSELLKCIRSNFKFKKYTGIFEADLKYLLKNIHEKLAALGIYFGLDYAVINRVAAIIKDTTQERGKVSSIEKQVNNCQHFLPDEYSPFSDMKHYGEALFPSSTKGRSKTWWAHKEGNIIASAGPPNDTNKGNSEYFFQLLLEEKPGYVIALGKFGIDFLDYSVSKKYQNLQIMRDNDLLTITDGKISHTCCVVNFISLDKINLKHLFSIYRQTSDSNPTLIHCDFGVGLTGQMRLIFKALDLMKTDQNFKQVFDKLSQSVPLDAREQKYIDDKISELVCKLRKIRYAFEDEAELKGAVNQLTALCAERSRPNIKEVFGIRESEIVAQSKSCDTPNSTPSFFSLNKNH